MDEQWWAIGRTLLVVGFVCATLGVVLLALVYRSLRRIRVPSDADFFSTLRVVPLGLVMALDLLDLSLDIFATPIVWIVLSRFRLHALRNVAAVEALIPFTQPIPVLTLSWFLARLLGLGDAPRGSQPYGIDTEGSTSLPDRPSEVRPGEFRSRARR